MAAVKHRVTIKGVKDGLVFLFDDTCTFGELVEDLKHKLEKTHQNILTGPLIHVFVKLGNRYATDEEKEELRSIIAARGNLLVQSIDSEPDKLKALEEGRIQVIKSIVRSGQVLHVEGNVMLMGDVNPGGIITATGDIYVMGSLRGMAHAGFSGNETSIIAASHMRPTQLRISQVISRPPDEWGVGDTYMEFAYINNGVMEIDKIQHLHRIRPDA
ncbi:septum site-determining protein MinC [Gorillibacterium sp. sgz5001074]|uniref:septum site-determining protein MinC n=1 Tax=Gorillibacterium sp. sgz5001074 TaxID=3446695 RepID=UPI003F6700A7